MFDMTIFSVVCFLIKLMREQEKGSLKTDEWLGVVAKFRVQAILNP